MIAEPGSSLVLFNPGAEQSSNTQTLFKSTPGLADHDLLNPCKPNQTGCTNGSVLEPGDGEIDTFEEKVVITPGLSGEGPLHRRFP